MQVIYPDLENTIWPECQKLLDNTEKVELWKRIPTVAFNDRQSIMSFHGICKKCIDTTDPYLLESYLYELVIVSAYMLHAVYNIKYKSNVERPNMIQFIWPKCKEVIEHNATVKGKGNSWLDMDQYFWSRKLLEEGYEVVSAGDPAEMEKELYDVINVACFALHVMVKRRKRYESVGMKLP